MERASPHEFLKHWGAYLGMEEWQGIGLQKCWQSEEKQESVKPHAMCGKGNARG